MTRFFRLCRLLLAAVLLMGAVDVLDGSPPAAAAPAGNRTTHLGPMHLGSNESISVDIVNTGAAVHQATVTIAGADGAVLKRRQLEIAPGRSASVLHQAPDDLLIGVRVAAGDVNGDLITSASLISDGASNTTMVLGPSRTGSSFATSLFRLTNNESYRIHIFNPGSDPASYTVKQYDRAGLVTASSTVNVPAGRIASTFGRGPMDGRAVVRSHRGTAFISSGEVFTTSTRHTAYPVLIALLLP